LQPPRANHRRTRTAARRPFDVVVVAQYNYLLASVTPNWDRMVGNPRCRQIPWDDDDAQFAAWRDGRTGFPFIDAIQTQLRDEGWIHHLARHATACFLTRGDLWQSWERGQRHFEVGGRRAVAWRRSSAQKRIGARGRTLAERRARTASATPRCRAPRKRALFVRMR
jgi:hypothetical protein